MRTHAEIVKAIGVPKLAELADTPLQTVHSWVARDSIPAKHWALLVDHGLSTADELIAAAAKNPAKAA
jgi:hypothetical protein